MASPVKSKEIQVQKPAQSLQAFQAKLDTGGDSDLSYFKPVLIGAGAVLAVSLAFFGFRSWRSGQVEKYQTSLAEVQQAVQGDLGSAPQPAEIEKRMRENLPKLEALVANAPSSQRQDAQDLLNTWHLMLDGKGGTTTASSEPWSRIEMAQRDVALGKGQEALAALEPLRSDATPDAAWGNLYWKTLLQARSLQGSREEALKDFAEYKRRYREDADIAGMERILVGI